MSYRGNKKGSYGVQRHGSTVKFKVQRITKNGAYDSKTVSSPQTALDLYTKWKAEDSTKKVGLRQEANGASELISNVTMFQEQVQAESSGNDLEVSPSEIKEAISRANQEFPKHDFWQAEMIEIAMIPSVKHAIEIMNNGHKLNIERVQTKFGNGYIMEGWNRVRDDYYSTNPASVWDGIRREYIGAQDLESLRSVGLGNDYAKSQLRHFKIADEEENKSVPKMINSVKHEYSWKEKAWKKASPSHEQYEDSHLGW